MTEKKTEKAKPKKKKLSSKSAEIEKIVIELGKKNIPPEKIGLILRDQHGIPKARLYGKKIIEILKSHDIPYDSEIEFTQRKQERLRKHFAKHKHDYTAKQRIFKYTSKIHKLKKQAV